MSTRILDLGQYVPLPRFCAKCLGAKCPWDILSFGEKCLLALLKIIIRIIIIMNNYDIDQTDDDNIFEDIVNVRNNNYDKLVFKSRKFTLVVMSLSFS